jgi:hypothetical protein
MVTCFGFLFLVLGTLLLSIFGAARIFGRLFGVGGRSNAVLLS